MKIKICQRVPKNRLDDLIISRGQFYLQAPVGKLFCMTKRENGVQVMYVIHHGKVQRPCWISKLESYGLQYKVL